MHPYYKNGKLIGSIWTQVCNSPRVDRAVAVVNLVKHRSPHVICGSRCDSIMWYIVIVIHWALYVLVTWYVDIVLFVSRYRCCCFMLSIYDYPGITGSSSQSSTARPPAYPASRKVLEGGVNLDPGIRYQIIEFTVSPCT